jgi:hypothetical protein
LNWQRLGPYECRPEDKVSLGFVEGLNNEIRVIQRRAYGLADENYLPLAQNPHLHAAAALTRSEDYQTVAVAL